MVKHESLFVKTNLLKNINLESLTAKSLNEIILNDPSWAEIFNASKYQRKIKPEVILQTLKYMVQEVDEDDPKLIEFVKTLIYPPSTKPLNLSNPNKKHHSRSRSVCNFLTFFLGESLPSTVFKQFLDFLS